MATFSKPATTLAAPVMAASPFQLATRAPEGIASFIDTVIINMKLPDVVD
jgi:hypothetical protein